MSIAWLAPVALIGAGLIALPIAIHLLVRQHARQLAYPSLRFLRQTQLSAFRRRTIQDAWLLLCRAAIVTAAAAALAGPVLRTSSRTAGYASRVARAVVVVESVDESVIAQSASGAFRSAAFRRASIADALADAVRWLDQQPPSAREIVITGALRRGAVTATDLAVIPADIGVRFEMVPTPSPADVTWPILARRNGMLVRIDRAVRFDTDATRVTDGAAAPVASDLISIIARDEETPLAEAALRAALDAGVPWGDFERRILIAWDGAKTESIAPAPNLRIIRMAVPSPPSSAADAVLAALDEASDRSRHLEPVTILPEQLNKWSRPPGPPGAGPVADEGDRRWVWAFALALLGLEAWLRRGRRANAPAVAGEPEARVA